MDEDDKKIMIVGGALLGGAALLAFAKDKLPGGSGAPSSDEPEPEPATISGTSTHEFIPSGSLSPTPTAEKPVEVYVWNGVGFSYQYTDQETADRMHGILENAPEGSYAVQSQEGIVVIRPTTPEEEEEEQKYIDEYLAEREEKEAEVQEKLTTQQNVRKTTLKCDRWVYKGPKQLDPADLRYSFTAVGGVEITSYKGTKQLSGNSDGSWNVQSAFVTSETPAERWIVVLYRFDRDDTGLPLGQRSKKYYPFAFKGGKA